LNFGQKQEGGDVIQLSKYLRKAVKLEPIGYVEKEKVPKEQPQAAEEQKHQVPIDEVVGQDAEDVQVDYALNQARHEKEENPEAEFVA